MDHRAQSMSQASVRRWSVYGITLESAHDFVSPLIAADPSDPADVVFEVTTAPISLQPDRGPHAPLAGIRVPKLVDFQIFPDRIVAHVPTGSSDGMAEIHLLSSALSTWLEYRGVLALHASAVVIDGKAVAFMASSRGGKTALGATFLRDGRPLLTDDILAIDVPQGRDNMAEPIIARPGYPQMRMWPDNAEFFVGEGWQGLPLVHPEYPKYRVRVGSDGMGEFWSSPVPLGAVFLPERREGSDREIRIDPVRPMDAALEIARNTFSPRALSAPDLQPERLARLAGLVERVPVMRLAYNSGYGELSRVRQAVLDTFKSVQSAAPNEKERSRPRPD